MTMTVIGTMVKTARWAIMICEEKVGPGLDCAAVVGWPQK